MSRRLQNPEPKAKHYFWDQNGFDVVQPYIPSWIHAEKFVFADFRWGHYRGEERPAGSSYHDLRDLDFLTDHCVKEAKMRQPGRVALLPLAMGTLTYFSPTKFFPQTSEQLVDMIGNALVNTSSTEDDWGYEETEWRMRRLLAGLFASDVNLESVHLDEESGFSFWHLPKMSWKTVGDPEIEDAVRFWYMVFEHPKIQKFLPANLERMEDLWIQQDTKDEDGNPIKRWRYKSEGVTAWNTIGNEAMHRNLERAIVDPVWDIYDRRVPISNYQYSEHDWSHTDQNGWVTAPEDRAMGNYSSCTTYLGRRGNRYNKLGDEEAVRARFVDKRNQVRSMMSATPNGCVWCSNPHYGLPDGFNQKRYRCYALAGMLDDARHGVTYFKWWNGYRNTPTSPYMPGTDGEERLPGRFMEAIEQVWQHRPKEIQPLENDERVIEGMLAEAADFLGYDERDIYDR